MWLQALTPIKLRLDDNTTRIAAAGGPPFELADDAGAELVGLAAALEVDAPPQPAVKPTTKK